MIRIRYREDAELRGFFSLDYLKIRFYQRLRDSESASSVSHFANDIYFIEIATPPLAASFCFNLVVLFTDTFRILYDCGLVL